MRTEREKERIGKELLKHTPMREETFGAQRRREEAHRAIPNDSQPWMVVYFGLLDYGVLWIGPENGSETVAEQEAEWWRNEIRQGMWLLPFSKRPDPESVMVRQQWDLDALTKAIHDTYE